LYTVVLALSIGCASKPAIKQGLPSGQPEEQPAESQGRNLVVRLDQAVGTDLSKTGDRVTAHVATPLVDRAGRTLVPDGALVEGHAVRSECGKGAAPPTLELVFDRIIIDGRAHPVHAVVASQDLELLSGGSDPQIAARGKAGGAVLGLIFMNLPGAVIGGAIGGAGGGAKAVANRVACARLPAGSFLTLRLLTAAAR
jgi:hypothetical protein